MTIALGIRAEENKGIVLASDTQVTQGGMKGEETKFVAAMGVQLGKPNPDYVSPGECVVFGAGDKGYMDAFSEDADKMFLENPTLVGDDLRHKFGDYLKRFYADHVIPFLPLSTDERPDIEMLIGTFRKHRLDLFITDRTTIRTAGTYAVVGAGGPFAERLLRRLWRPAGIRETQILAAYVVYLVKESIEGCGKSTHIATLYDAASHPDEPKVDVAKLETAFATKWLAAEQETVWKLIAES